MSVTPETSHLSKSSEVSEEQPLNSHCIFDTLEVFHPETSRADRDLHP